MVIIAAKSMIISPSNQSYYFEIDNTQAAEHSAISADLRPTGVRRQVSGLGAACHIFDGVSGDYSVGGTDGAFHRGACGQVGNGHGRFAQRHVWKCM